MLQTLAEATEEVAQAAGKGAVELGESQAGKQLGHGIDVGDSGKLVESIADDVDFPDVGAGTVLADSGKVEKSGAENIAQFEKLRSYYAAKEVVNAERVGSALAKSDKNHLSASFVSESQLAAGKVFLLRGNDGVQRTLLQTKGQLDGKSGVFEYIIEGNGTVSHQLFKQGRINGVPTRITK